MADKKITDLTAAAAVAALTDLVECVQAAATVPVSRKLTYQQFLDAQSLLAAATPTLASIIPGTNAGTAKAFTPQKLLDLTGSLAATSGGPDLSDKFLVYDISGTAATVSTLSQIWDSASQLPTDDPLVADDTLLFVKDSDGSTNRITYENFLMSSVGLDAALPVLDDKFTFLDTSDSDTPKQATIQEHWDTLAVLADEDPALGDLLAFNDAGDQVTKSCSTEDILGLVDQLNAADSPLPNTTLLLANNGSGTPKKLDVDDLATYIGVNSTNNIWNESKFTSRKTVFRTGPTAVDVGETASSSGTGSVTAATASSLNPFGATYTTGSTSTNIFGWTSTGHHITGVPGGAYWEFLIKWPETTSVRYFCGIGSNSAVNMAASGDTPGVSFHVAFLRWSTNASDTNLKFCTGGASAQTTTDLGVAKPTDPFRLRIVSRSTGTAIDVYINGVIVGNGITGNLPTVTQAMQMTGSVVTLTNATKTMSMYEQASTVQY